MNPSGSKSPSPEEKLLRLIRGKGPAVARSAAAKVMRRARTMPRISWRLPAWWLAAVNAMLGLVVAAGLGWIGWLLWAPAPLPQADDAPVAPPAVDLAAKLLDGGPPVSVVSAASRPLFAGPSAAVASGPRGPAGPSAAASTLVQRLSLIGIVSGEPPQAIIEDAETQKTYFVTAGQGFLEGMIVEEIHDNRVVLRLGDERVDLSL